MKKFLLMSFLFLGSLLFLQSCSPYYYDRAYGYSRPYPPPPPRVYVRPAVPYYSAPPPVYHHRRHSRSRYYRY